VRYEATIEVPSPQAADAIELCTTVCGRQVSRDDVMYTWSSKFENGYAVDVKIVASGEPETDPCWCEAVLFNEKGGEVMYTDPDFDNGPFGPWILRDGDDKYVVTVRRQGDS